MHNTNQNFQEMIEKWDVFYNETFPLIREYCIQHGIRPGTSITLLEKAFLKLSFEYPNLIQEDYVHVVEKLFDIVLDLQDRMTDEQNLHNNALVLLSRYYNAN